jgi:hypothetical protein
MSYRDPKQGIGVRVYKVKVFARFQRRERIADASLAKAVRSAEDRLIDADLGGGLIKQRVARPGQGKSGGYRTVIVYRRGDMAIFLLGFAKSERANIDDDELEELRGQARVFLRLSTDQIEAAIAAEELTEVSYGYEEKG